MEGSDHDDRNTVAGRGMVLIMMTGIAGMWMVLIMITGIAGRWMVLINELL